MRDLLFSEKISAPLKFERTVHGRVFKKIFLKIFFLKVLVGDLLFSEKVFLPLKSKGHPHGRVFKKFFLKDFLYIILVD